VALVGAGGCAKLLGYGDGGRKAAEIKQYPDGPDGLKALFQDILDATKKDDRDLVHDIMATTQMTDADLQALFGPQAATLTPRYHKLMETLINPGSMELVAQIYDRKLDTIEVVPIDPAAKDASAEDKALKGALQVPLKWYSVRVKKAGDARGLRYDFYFYRNGKWLTGNQIAKSLDGYRPPDGGTK
jgi:hypothetical protein